MSYPPESQAARLLGGDPGVVALVYRWIARALATPRFWRLRHDWVDLHQEAMVRVIKSLRSGRFDPAQDLQAYVQVLTRYTAREALRRSSVARRSLATTVPDRPGHASVEAAAVSKQMARAVLDRASTECRDLIRLYFLEERDYPEVASRLGVPVGTVKSRLARCLRCIGRLLAARRRLQGAVRSGPGTNAARPGLPPLHRIPLRESGD